MKPILAEVNLEQTSRARRCTNKDGEVVETFVDGFDYKLKARQIGGVLLKLGDKIEHKGATLYVTSTRTEQCQGAKYFIEAEGGTVDPNKELLHNMMFHGHGRS